MFKAYLASGIVIAVIGGALTGAAYQLGRFNAQLTNEMVSGFAMQARPVTQARAVPTPFPSKLHKKRKVMIARR